MMEFNAAIAASWSVAVVRPAREVGGARDGIGLAPEAGAPTRIAALTYSLAGTALR